MYPRTRTRSDYSGNYATPSTASFAWRYQRLLKALLWVGLGFILGMIYGKALLAPRCETLALAEAEKAVVSAKELKSHGKVTKSSRV